LNNERAAPVKEHEMTDVETPHKLVLVNRYDASPEHGGTEQEFRQTGVVTDEHFEALKAGTEMFFTRLGEFLAR
jgi:hypothetical protein